MLKESDFRKSMERVLAFYPRAREGDDAQELSAWSSALLEKLMWMRPERFDMVTRELVGELPRYRTDLRSKNFISVYFKLAETYGWEKKAENSCASCGGNSLVYRWVRDQKNNREYEAVKPCPTCSNVSRWSKKEHLEEIDAPTLTTRLEDALTPAAAHYIVTTLGDKTVAHLPEAMLVRLLESAGNYFPTAPPAEESNESAQVHGPSTLAEIPPQASPIRPASEAPVTSEEPAPSPVLDTETISDDDAERLGIPF